MYWQYLQHASGQALDDHDDDDDDDFDIFLKP